MSGVEMWLLEVALIIIFAKLLEGFARQIGVPRVVFLRYLRHVCRDR